MSSVLSVRGLDVEYVTADGVTQAVSGVSFDVAPGEILGLVGESGSGKSTVLHALLRTMGSPARISGGQVTVQGTDVLALSADALRGLRWRQASIVFQSALNALNPVMTIQQQIADTLDAHAFGDADAIAQRAQELFALVGIEPEHLRSYPHELSGGMRQRVAVALAVALEPALVLMDEPTTALDVVVERQVLQQVLALQRRLGFAVVFVTHDIALLLELADRIGVMQHGRLVELGTADSVRRGGVHPYTNKLLNAMPTPISEPLPATASRDPERTPLLAIHGLSVTFPIGAALRRRSLQANRQISLHVDRAEIVALVGESGSGKSTLGRAICRLVPASGGRIELEGTDVLSTERGGASQAYRHRVQMVFQDPFASLNPAHTIEHHLVRPLLHHGRATRTNARQLAGALLDRVGLSPGPSFLTRHPHSLSGGERQRVAIARALAAGPDLLVADEPTSMLDLSLRLDILGLLRQLRDEEGLAILLITHDLAAARWLSDRVVVPYGGAVMEQGPAEDLARNPLHPYTRLLVAAAPQTSGTLARDLPADPGIPQLIDPPDACPFVGRCRQAEAQCTQGLPTLRPRPGGGQVRCVLTEP